MPTPRGSHARLAVALTALALSGTLSARPFTVDDLVALRRIGEVQLSPDGSALVYTLREADVAENKAVTALWRLRLSAGAAPERLSIAGQNAASPRFSADGRHLYFLSARSGSNQLWRLPLAGGEAEQVSAAARDVGSFRLFPDGGRVLLSFEVLPACGADLACTVEGLKRKELPKASGRWHDRLFVRHWDQFKDGTRAQLFVAPIAADGKLGALTHLSAGIDGDVPSKPFGGDGDYAISPDGRTVWFSARIAGRDEPWRTNFDLYQVPADGSAAPVNLTADNPAWDAHPVPSPDGRHLLYQAMTRPGFEADRFRLMLRDLATGKTREIAADWDHSGDTPQFSPDGRTIYLTADSVGQKPLFAIDVVSGKVRKLTTDGNVAGFTVSKGALYLLHNHLARPNEIFSLPAGGGAMKQLTAVNADLLAGVEFGAFEQFSFRGSNDETVYGWLVKPVGFEAGKRYPVAYLIHGGPQGSFMNQFHYRWNPQTYAGQGFVAVMVDFHGSTGYGQAFTDSISQDWGGKPLVDLQKGLAHVAASYDFADTSRACALGGSYGGFMVNWIAGQWPDGFRCLVSHAGVFDNRFMGYSTEELWFSEWENGGTPYEVPEAYERFNPVHHVAKWKAPILVIHGQLDYRVPFEQGLAAFTAAQRRGIDSEFLWFPDENHWILKPQNSQLWHRSVEAFLKRHTAP